MPSLEFRPPRRSKRLLALVSTCAVMGAFAAAPSPAAAYEQHFCQYAGLGSGWNCFAGSLHTLQYVNGWSIGSHQRICAASFTAPWGGQNSDWRCDYGFTQKYLGGRVQGVGAIHNGDPWWMTGYGVQGF